jgi:predicted nuclease of predicted toxin-antitoxin system|tara:strand:+ start:344 stop:700 length:357 start_codon:yes stop_codon:yes gene_type:complete
MKFLLDANIPYSSINIFKKFNHDVQHARKIGMANALDDDIIEHARKHNQILVTKDLGFGNTLNYPIKSHNGIIILRLPFYYIAKQINNALLDFLKSVKEGQIENSVTIIQLGRYRTRR